MPQDVFLFQRCCAWEEGFAAPCRAPLRTELVDVTDEPCTFLGADASGRGLRPDVTWSITTSALRSSSSLGVQGTRRFQLLRFFPRSLLPEEYVLSIVLLHIFVGFARTWIRSCPLNRRAVNCIRPSTLRLTLKIRVSTRVPRILSARELYVSCLSSTSLFPQRTTSTSARDHLKMNVAFVGNNEHFDNKIWCYCVPELIAWYRQ